MQSILITGANSGIVYATVVQAAKQGWRIITCGRNIEKLEQLTSEYSNIDYLAFYLTNQFSFQTNLGSLQIDAVILNARTCEYIEVEEFDSAMFKRVFNANFFSAIHCIEALLPNMTAGSQIVFVDSLARLLPFTKSEAYGASKATMHYLAKTL